MLNTASSQPLAMAGVFGMWLDPARLNNLFITLVVAALLLAAALAARKKSFPVRRLPEMDAFDEAVSRACACGRPVLYVPGVGQASSMATAASMSILGGVAAMCAARGARLIVPHYDPVVLGICTEIVGKAYERSGRSPEEAANANFFVSQDQFSYVAAVDGLISREKPAACFYMGQFMAESLLLTEVGASSGALQVAGTDAESQLPFFFASCDHALLGEEFYAAGAYLSGDPVLRASLRAQDVVKILAAAILAAALAALALCAAFGRPDLVQSVLELLRVR